MKVCQRSENKHGFYKNTVGLRSGNSPDSDSACLKVVRYVKIIQFQDMLNENRFLGTFSFHDKRPMLLGSNRWLPHFPEMPDGGLAACKDYLTLKNFIQLI